MQYRFFDGDTEFWDKDEINLSVQELRKRFGTQKDKVSSEEDGKNPAIKNTANATGNTKFGVETDDIGTAN